MPDASPNHSICPNCGRPVMLRISLDRQLSDVPAFLVGCDNLGTGNRRCSLSWADGFSYVDKQTAWQAWEERLMELADGNGSTDGMPVGEAVRQRREAYESFRAGNGGLSDTGNTYYNPHL